MITVIIIIIILILFIIIITVIICKQPLETWKVYTFCLFWFTIEILCSSKQIKIGVYKMLYAGVRSEYFST